MPKEYLDKIRAKYPQYSDMSDSVLASSILKKYPQYQDVLGDMIAPSQPPPSALQQAQQIFNQPVEMGKEAYGEFARGNIGPGSMKLLRAGVGFIPSVYGAATQATRAIPFVGDPLANVLELPGRVLGGVSGAIESGANILGQQFPTSADTSQTVQQAHALASEVLPFAIGATLPPVVRGVGRRVESTATGLATSAFRSGENLAQAREIGKFAQERGVTLKEAANPVTKKLFKGRAEVQGNIQRINAQINNDVINPATQAGAQISGAAIRSKLEALKNEFQSELLPDNTAINAIDRQIESLNERLGPNGNLTPRQAQDLKVANNDILGRYYKNREKLGNLKRWEATKQEGIAAANDALRQQLEELHPQLKGANWEEGRYIQLRNAIDQYLFEKATGRGGPSLVLRARPGMGAGVSLYDLMGFRPFRSKLAVVLGKAGRAMSGNRAQPFGGFNSPYQSPPDAGSTTAMPPPDFGGGWTGPPLRGMPITPRPPMGLPPGPTGTLPPSRGPRGFLPPVSPQSVIESQGLKYKGSNGSGLIFFDDPQTGSTLAIQAKDFSPQAIQAKVQASRETFAGQPAKYDKTQAGLQGNMFNIQAKQPLKAITSTIPLSKQVEGTMFAPPKPVEQSLFEPHQISNMPPPIRSQVKQDAQMMLQDIKQSAATSAKGGIGRETSDMSGRPGFGDVTSRWGNASTFPDWFQELGVNSETVIKNLEKIIKDDPKNLNAKRLIDKIVEMRTRGVFDRRFGEIPPDAEFNRLYEQYLSGLR